MPAFLVRCPPRALRPQDRPGCATPADGDPYRNRTCVRCLRGSRPTARRTGRELVRKAEVSKPHGRTVSLFSRQVAPSQRGIPSRAEGQRIERWRGRPRPSLSKRAPSHSVNPPDASARREAPPKAPPARFERASFGLEGRCASSRATGASRTVTDSPRTTTRSRPGDLSRTKAALFPLSYGGVASSRRGSNSHGCEPTGAEPGRVFLFLHARMVDPAGLEPARGSLQTRCTATRALGPWSRWVESNDRGHNAARVTAALL
jgi:hypothetical protein